MRNQITQSQDQSYIVTCVGNFREEEHDYSDEEGSSRMKFAVDGRDQELRKMHKTLQDAMNEEEEEGSDHENQWEEQQIRKGVTILVVSYVLVRLCYRGLSGNCSGGGEP